MINAVVFFTAVSILLIISSLFESGQPRFKRVYYFIIMVLIWGGSKFNGLDWMNYLGTYEIYSTPEGITYRPFEPGFSYLMLAFSRIGLPYTFFIFFISVINTACLLWFMDRIKVRRWGWSLAIVFLSLGWTVYQEQIRQAMAISLLFIFYVHALNGKWYRATLFILLAISIHFTAIFGITLYFIMNHIKKNEGRPLSWRAMIFATGILSLIIIIYNLFGTTGFYASIGLAKLQEKFDYYYNSDSYGGSLFNAGMFAYIIGFFSLILSKKRNIKDVPIWHSIAWSISMLWCLAGPLLRTSAILIRLENYLIIFLPFALASYQGFSYFTNKAYPARIIIGSICGFVLAASFSVRILMQPNYIPWVDKYQNIFIQIITDPSSIQAGERDIRRSTLCEALLANGGEPCDKQP